MVHTRALLRVRGCCSASAGTTVRTPGVTPLSARATTLPGSTPDTILSVQVQVKFASYRTNRFRVWDPVALVHSRSGAATPSIRFQTSPSPKVEPQTHKQSLPLPLLQPLATTSCFLSPRICLSRLFQRSGIPRWVGFRDWLLSLTITSSGSSTL